MGKKKKKKKKKKEKRGFEFGISTHFSREYRSGSLILGEKEKYQYHKLGTRSTVAFSPVATIRREYVIG